MASDLSGIHIQTSLCAESVDALRTVASGVHIASGQANTILLTRQLLASRPQQANPVAAADWLSRADAELERRQSFVTTALRVRMAVARRVNAPRLRPNSRDLSTLMSAPYGAVCLERAHHTAR